MGKVLKDRRGVLGGTIHGVSPKVAKQRQFPPPLEPLPPAAAELQWAIDVYKMEHGLKRISMLELLGVLEELGYHRD
jgi:hypothetical protein